MEHNRENCAILAERIVEDMSLEDLKDYVYEDIRHLMVCNRELFEANLEFYGDEDGSDD